MTEKQLTEREIKALQVMHGWFLHRPDRENTKSRTICLSRDAPVQTLNFGKLRVSTSMRFSM